MKYSPFLTPKNFTPVYTKHINESCGRFTSTPTSTVASRKPIPFKKGINKYLAASIMPSVKVALTRCAVVSPEDPLLWLSRSFLDMSSSGDRYEIRQKSAVLRTYTPIPSSSALSTIALPSTTTRTTPTATTTPDTTSLLTTTTATASDVSLTLLPEDILTIDQATAPSSQLENSMFYKSTHPTLKPLSAWQKRMERVTGKSVQATTQTGGNGRGVDQCTQFRPTTQQRGSQTTLTGTKVLEELGQEMKHYVQRNSELRSEEEAIHAVFQRVYFHSTGLHERLQSFFNAIDVHQEGRVDRTTLLQGLVRYQHSSRAIPGLKQLFRPKRWQQTFQEICDAGTENNGTAHTTTTTNNKSFSSSRHRRTITLPGIKQWLSTNTATISIQDFVKALDQDPVLQTVLRWSECLHPLLRPRTFNHLFKQIATHGNGSAGGSTYSTGGSSNSSNSASSNAVYYDPTRMTEQQLLGYIRDCRVGSAEDCRSETIAELFHLMCEEDGMVGKHHLLKMITGTNTSYEAEEVRRVIQFSVSLRPLLQPRTWSARFDAMDHDGDGLLSFVEFNQFITSFTSDESMLAKQEEDLRIQQIEMQIAQDLTLQTMQHVKVLFDTVDKQGTGLMHKMALLQVVLDDEEYRELLRTTPPLRPLLYPGKWSSVFAQIDRDDDQKLNYGEFVEFIFASYAHSLATDSGTG